MVKLEGFEANLFTGVFDLPLTADVSGSQLMVDLTPKGSKVGLQTLFWLVL